MTALILLYAGSFIFSYDRTNTRSASHLWIDSGAALKVNRIVLNSGREEFELLRKNDQWFINVNNSEYPARRLRVEDFLNIFTTRSSWPVRSSSASSHERYGLGSSASRVTMYADNSILLDLYLGDDDIMGNESYYRKIGQNEVRSGSSAVRTYLTGSVTSWYNLRLIPESENGKISINDVQRLTVINGEDNQIFSRSGRTWNITGINIANPDMKNAEEYINFILNAEGEDLIASDGYIQNQLPEHFPVRVSEIDFNHSRIMLEMGNGGILTISVSDSDEAGKRYAKISNNNYIFQIPAWVSLRLFRDPGSFEAE